MPELNYELESRKEHVNIGLVLYRDSEKDKLFVATLELFGNGYDISLYENNNCTEIKKSVVRNTRYEFLQYTDDFEKMVVDINGELFVVTEQQFNRVKEYYDTKDSDTDYEENIKRLNENQNALERVKMYNGFPLSITPTDFLYLVKRLNEKMGLKIIESNENEGFSVYRCLRGKDEEFGVGCLLDDRKISKNDIKLLHEIALRNFLIFSYFDFGLNKYKDNQGADIDIICGDEFIQMIKKYLNIDIT
ncbi:hypothetical protein [Dehalobacter restrictus]|uniref:Uncharacterized protein n=1 Tax=Dehalobacter restrictus TaxID=55583 RepID=A0A857DJJ0_9FIRM|nr:hypothetical protein [Dehalobacter restrictus]QHA01464.1 hypothetical protein GQ588_12840 [Dehalobacter restrictus]